MSGGAGFSTRRRRGAEIPERKKPRARSEGVGGLEVWRLGSVAEGLWPADSDRRTRYSEDMPVPIEFLRGVLGILCIVFAHMAGRSAYGIARGDQKKSRFYAWMIRATLCGGALLFRHEVDGVVIGVFALAAVAAGVGWWVESRPKQTEDLTHEIFPDQP